HGVQVLQRGTQDRSRSPGRARVHRRGVLDDEQPAEGRGAPRPTEQAVLLPVLRVHRAEEGRGEIQDGVGVEVARLRARRGKTNARHAGRFCLQHTSGEIPGRGGYLRCLLTSLVISNMLTLLLPPKTAFRASSALIMRRFFVSCSLFLLM